jgi:hypothetical protein
MAVQPKKREQKEVLRFEVDITQAELRTGTNAVGLTTETLHYQVTMVLGSSSGPRMTGALRPFMSSRGTTISVGVGSVGLLRARER